MSGDQSENPNSNQQDQKQFDGGSAQFDDQQQHQRRFQPNNFRGRGRGFGGGPPRGFRGRGRGFGGRGGGGPRHGDDRGQDNDMNDRMGGHQGGGGGFRFEDKLMEKLAQIGGPAVDLPPIELTDRKYSGKFRLYIGNLPDVTDEELKELLGKYGDCGELFLNKEKSFAFAKFDYLATAEKVSLV